MTSPRPQREITHIQGLSIMNQSTKTSSRYNGVIGPDMNNVINVSGWTKRIFLIFFYTFYFSLSHLAVIYLPASVFILR